MTKKNFWVKNLLWAVLISVLTLGIITACSNSSSVEVKPFVGYKAPDFELEDFSGHKVKLSDMCGRTVVVTFWSLDCQYCLQEMPDFDEYYKSKPSDVEIFMINVDLEEQKKVPAYIDHYGYSFPVLKDDMANTLKNYSVRGVPTTFIIGKDGVISSRVEGPLTKSKLESLIDAENNSKPLVPS